MNKDVLNTKIQAVCLVSQTSGWSDHFATIIDGLAMEGVEIQVYTSVEGSKSFPLSNSYSIHSVAYGRSDLCASIQTIFKISRMIQASRDACTFIYGESIQHLILAFLIKGKIIVKIGDPKCHIGVRIWEKIIAWISKLYFIIRAKNLLVASPIVALQLADAFKMVEVFFPFKDKIKAFGFANLIQFDRVVGDVVLSGSKKWDFVYFGRVEPYKGLNVLLGSIRRLNEEGFFPRVLILTKSKIPLGGCQRVEVISEYLSHEQLAMYIRQSRWGVFSYLEATGTHTVQICNRCGTPVIASRVGSFIDLIDEDKNGILVPPNDILSLASVLKSALDGSTKCLNGEELVLWSRIAFSNHVSSKIIKKVIDSVND